MDSDLEGLYEDDGETYDTPCKLRSSTDVDIQHHSTPTLQKALIRGGYKIHSSAPNLENDSNQCNVPTHPHLRDIRALAAKVCGNYAEEDTIDQEIYMNTTFNAEAQLSRAGSLKQISGSLTNVRRGSTTTRIDDLKRVLENSPLSPEEYYMAPPSLPSNLTSDSGNATSQSPGFYDAPSNIEHAALPPLPQTTDPLHFVNLQLSLEQEDTECFYEGIHDADVDDDDNFYEGLENPSDSYYEGLGETDFYEGVVEDVFYEGLPEQSELEDDITALNGLIYSLNKPDTPYVPPKPPGVPLQNPLKHLQPLPQIPQINVQSDGDSLLRKSPSLQRLPSGSPPVPPTCNTFPKAKSMLDVSRRISVCSKACSLGTESDEGLYDGIELDPDEGLYDGIELDPDDGSKENSSVRSDKSRSYSFRVKRKVKKTRERTTSQIGHFKESFSHTLQEKRGKWRESKARQELKTAFKETKNVASEIAQNTELIYSTGRAAIQRRTSKTVRRRAASQDKEGDHHVTVRDRTAVELDLPGGTGTPGYHSLPFMSILPSEISQQVPGLERSGCSKELETSSDYRSSITSGSRGPVPLSSHASSNVSGSPVTMATRAVTMATRDVTMATRDVWPAALELVNPAEVGAGEEGYTEMENAIGGLLYLSEEAPGVPRHAGSADPGITRAHTTSSLPGQGNVTDRHKVLQQILDHEYRYIVSLKDMMKVYAAPLQHTQSHKTLIEPATAQDIFFRIPEITVHHEFFYEQLRRRSMTWSRHQSLGDILLQLFHKPGLFSAYASYIDNFNHALEIVRDTRAARPAFSKLLDKLRSKSNQLSLEDLIYLPVDHIPVYLELLKDLIKQTTQDDPDYTYLYLAKDEVEKLILKLEERKAQAEKSFSVKLLEKKISGLPGSLIAPQRYIIAVERIRELDIMTDRSDDRHLVVMSDLLLCLKPVTRSSNSVMSASPAAEHQYLWDCLITDVEIKSVNTAVVKEDHTPHEESEGYQSLKDDLDLLNQIAQLRKALKGSYTALRLDKLPEVQEKLKKEISERQFSAESRRGRILDIVRPVNSPCTSTQFHRFLFPTAVKRATWAADLLQRQEMMHHTKDLDWCQIGEKEVVGHARLATLLPVIKHMTPIGLTTPSHFSVECAAANADFTCPVTQDILYRIMSTGDENYANVDDDEDIPLLPPGAAPAQDTPLYDEDLTPTRNQPVSLPDLPPLRNTPNVPRIISPAQARSPYIVTRNTSEHASNAAQHASNAAQHAPLQRCQTYNGEIKSPAVDLIVPPVPGNHPLQGGHSLSVAMSSDRKSFIDLIQSVPKEFNMDDREDENLYETPYEISLLRAQKQQLMRSVEDGLMGSSSDLTNTHDAEETCCHGDAEETQESIELEESQEVAWNSSLPDLDGPGLAVPHAAAEGFVSLSRLEHLNLADFPDESFNLELGSLQPVQDLPTRAPESLLVDKYGQIYTDKIASLISGPLCSTIPPESLLPDTAGRNTLTGPASLCELDSEDEDDTPRYDSQLHLNRTVQSSLTSSSTTTELPHIILDSSEFMQGAIPEVTPATPREAHADPDSLGGVALYQNVASSTQKMRTKVIRRESSKRSSKRSITRKPQLSSSVRAGSSVCSDDEWQDPDCYENINEDTGDYELKPTDVFLCGHGQNGTGEIVVFRLSEPTPHIALNIALDGSQVLCCHMVPGKENSLWVGTQDARLLVYLMSDPSSTLMEQHLDGGPIVCIAHIEDSVFVGTAEGFVHVFTRDASDSEEETSINEWCDNDPISKKLGNNSICVMLPISDNMWCSCGCQIFVISPASVTVEHLFSTHNNTSAQVYKMVNSGSGVWLAIRNSPVVRLFHAKTGEHLEDYDISTLVHHLFTGSQNAARRRRSENVRVTALLASPSTGALWIGTSAGVIIVVPIVKPPTAPKICGPPFLSYMGHYDGVRFLIQAQSRVRRFIESQSTEEEDVYEEITSQVVISCGKGMEDYRDLTSGSVDKSFALQDSSYLIVWHYPTPDT